MHTCNCQHSNYSNYNYHPYCVQLYNYSYSQLLVNDYNYNTCIIIATIVVTTPGQNRTRVDQIQVVLRLTLPLSQYQV